MSDHEMLERLDRRLDAYDEVIDLHRESIEDNDSERTECIESELFGMLCFDTLDYGWDRSALQDIGRRIYEAMSY